MKPTIYVLVLTMGIGVLAGGCVRDRSTPYLENEVGTLEKQLDEADREYAKLVADRERLEGDIGDAQLLVERAAALLEEKKRLEEELAIARIDLERSGATTGTGGALYDARTYDRGLPDELPFKPSFTKVHIVAKGESLSLIAGYDEYYGNQLLWPYIYISNKRFIKDPNWIFEGLQLNVPME